jgi:purine-nucleoside phosphorylase
MATPHLNAPDGIIAETVLLPGDPLRARWIAENFLDDPILHNDVRGMLGYTGTYQGKKVSVQGTGMGVPSLAIYATELVRFYGAKKLIRVGSAGSYQKDVKVRDIIIAMSSASTVPFSSYAVPFPGVYSPCAHPELFLTAVQKAKELGLSPKIGTILTTDGFYNDTPDKWQRWASMGVLAVEMETYGLYSIGVSENVQTLSLLTISDSLVTGETTTPEERQSTFKEMIELALNLA